MEIIEHIKKEYGKELHTPGTHMTIKKTDLEDLMRELKNINDLLDYAQGNDH
jgi:hypothetical protein